MTILSIEEICIGGGSGQPQIDRRVGRLLRDGFVSFVKEREIERDCFKVPMHSYLFIIIIRSAIYSSGICYLFKHKQDGYHRSLSAEQPQVFHS